MIAVIQAEGPCEICTASVACCLAEPYLIRRKIQDATGLR